jgi:hypothetical protein
LLRSGVYVTLRDGKTTFTARFETDEVQKPASDLESFLAGTFAEGEEDSPMLKCAVAGTLAGILVTAVALALVSRLIFY